MQRAWNCHRRQRSVDHVTIPFFPKKPGFQNRLGDLLDKQGDPICFADDLIQHFVWQPLSVKHLAYYFGTRLLVEAIEGDGGYVRVIKPGWLHFRPVGHDQQYGMRVEPIDDPVQKLHGTGVRPLNILENA